VWALKAGLDVVAKGKKSQPVLESNHGRPAWSQ